MVGMNQANSEDRTTPRICAGSNLLGCIIGYARMFLDFLNTKPSNDNKDRDAYKGGYVIYSIDFNACLKPNNKLVYDSSISGEHWLVTYNEDTIKYRPKPIGKMLVRSIRQTATENDYPIVDIELLIAIDTDIDVPFNTARSLKKGYYSITGPYVFHIRNHKVDKPYDITEISKTEWLNAKSISAAMLSLESNPPLYHVW